MLDMTTVAAHPQETVLQATAFQEVVKLPLDVGRKFLTLRFHQVTEHRIVLCNDLVKKRLLGPVALIQTSRVYRGRPRHISNGHDLHPCRTVWMTSLMDCF